MAMDNFSYKDSIRAAFASCMPCIISSSTVPVESRDNTSTDARAHSELEGLLRDTDTEAETLSLHSNIGGAGRRRQRKRPTFSLTLFGYTLFGRPPIYLSDDDEDERGWRRRPIGTVSSSTLDSDAAPLDASTIARLSSPDRAEIEQQRWEEEARRKAERKARRRERRERERMSALLTLNGGVLAEGDGFEGFQGSGASSLLPPPVAEFGPFVSGQEEQLATGDVSEDADDADLGGGLYTRKQRTAVWSGSRSDSRSRTSASTSSGDPSLHYNHHQLTQAVPSYPQTEMQLPKPAKTKKHRTSKRFSPLSSSTASQSTAPYTPIQSVSASPAVAAFPIPHERMEHAIEGQPEHIRGFPSIGLSGARGKTRDMGAFLASREAAQP